MQQSWQAVTRATVASCTVTQRCVDSNDTKWIQEKINEVGIGVDLGVNRVWGGFG